MKRTRGPDKPGRTRKKKAKTAGRPTLPANEQKRQRTVRVSDDDVALIKARTGHSLQEFLDTKITILRGDQAIDSSAMDSLKNFQKSLKDHFPKEGL